MSRSNAPAIPFARPSIGAEEEAAVLRVLRSGWLTTAQEAAAFETEFAAQAAVEHALAVNSATAGLHLALDALGVGAGDRVVMSPYTFTASAEVVRYVGADPQFVDIEADGYNIAMDALERNLRDRPPKIVMPIHIGGRRCDMPQIRALIERHAPAAQIVEDAAHAFPARLVDGPVLGTEGRIGVFSFYATKTITTGEGGMVVTNDAGCAERMRTMRLHGIDRAIWSRYSDPAASWRYAVVDAGFKYNLSDLAAALGRVQLRRAAELHHRRAQIVRRYCDAFANRDYLELPPGWELVYDDLRWVEHSWHLFALRLVPRRLTCNRDEFVAALQAAGIGVSVHYIPLHLMPYYQQRYGLKPEAFPRALSAYERSFSLPAYPGLTDEQIDRVIAEVTDIGDTHYRT